MDRLESADGGSVEHQALVKDILIEGLNRHIEVLHDAWQVDEPNIDKLDVLVFDVLENFFGVLKHDSSCTG